MEARSDALRDLAGRIADGDRIDWSDARALSGLSPEQAAAAHRLDLLRSGLRRARRAPAIEAPLASGYERIERLGRGGFGEVHRALDRALGREVALKVLREDVPLTAAARRRFVEEARLLASIDHPNVVKVYAIEDAGGVLTIAQELVRGRTLTAWVEEDGPLGADEAARIGADLCRALAELHARGIVHQDVKASNVMRAVGGRIVLLDFGVARRLGAEPQGAALEGTPLIMAPEQFQGAVEPRSDLFALGVLLYWLVSARYPIDADSVDDVRTELAAGRLVPLSDRRADLPPAFVELVERALALDPADRFPSAGAFERELREFLSGRRGRRRRAAGIAGAVALALTAAAGFLLFDRSGASGTPRLSQRLLALRAGAEVELFDGDPVAVGDQLELEVRSAQPLHLYVFNEDERGHLYALFPLPDHLPQNPVPGGAPLRLPGTRAGVPQSWQIDSAGGTESVVVIAGEQPVEAAEELLRTIAAAAPGAEATVPGLSEATRVRLRGIGSTVARVEVSDPAPPPRLADLVGATAGGSADAAVATYRLPHAASGH